MGSNGKKKRNQALLSPSPSSSNPNGQNPPIEASPTASKMGELTAIESSTCPHPNLSVVNPELEKKYIFKGDGSILLKDGSKIGVKQNVGVVRVLNVANSSPNTLITRETSYDPVDMESVLNVATHSPNPLQSMDSTTDSEHHQLAASSDHPSPDFIISNPSHSVVYGL